MILTLIMLTFFVTILICMLFVVGPTDTIFKREDD